NYKRADFDAFALRRVRRAVRVVEGGMSRKSRRSLVRIIAFEEDRLARRHVRKIVPLLRGVVLHGIGFSGPVAINEIRGDEVGRRDGPGMAKRQRRLERRAMDRPPQIDDRETPAKQFVGIESAQLELGADPVWARAEREVVVGARDGAPDSLLSSCGAVGI